MGEWREPTNLCFAEDRLYLVERDEVEEEDDEDEDEGDTTAPVQGRRILVLSLQGDILQVVTHLTEPTARFQSICCFDDKLLATYIYDMGGSNKDGLLALQGL